MEPIRGIKCSLLSAKAREVVTQVLLQIRENFPEDYDRLKASVRDIRPLSEKETVDGTLGEWQVRAGFACYAHYPVPKRTCL